MAEVDVAPDAAAPKPSRRSSMVALMSTRAFLGADDKVLLVKDSETAVAVIAQGYKELKVEVISSAGVASMLPAYEAPALPPPAPVAAAPAAAAARTESAPPPPKPRWGASVGPKFGVSATIEKIAANDPSITVADFSGNASFQIKSKEKTKELCEALKKNTVVTKLVLKNTDMYDEATEFLKELLTINSTIEELDLSKNKLKEEGAMAIAEGLAGNSGVQKLNVDGNSCAFGEKCLDKFLLAFETNITLNKIVWRLHSRSANALTTRMTRNSQIIRLRNSGRDYEHILPDGLKGKGL